MKQPFKVCVSCEKEYPFINNECPHCNYKGFDLYYMEVFKCPKCGSNEIKKLFNKALLCKDCIHTWDYVDENIPEPKIRPIYKKPLRMN